MTDFCKCPFRDILIPNNMHKNQSSRKEIIRRVAVYTLMMTTVVLLLIVLTLTVLGYRFNFQTQKVEQTGLVQYNSFPSGANIIVNGKSFNRTQSKGMLTPGQYQFSMQLDGYETWQKTLDIEAGTVTWLSYPRLVPTKKVVTTQHVFAGLSGVVASGDSRFMAGTRFDDSGQAQLTVIDVRNSREPKIQEYPLDLSTIIGPTTDVATEKTISVTEWSRSSRQILLRYSHKNEDSTSLTDWLLVDRESQSSVVNISKIVSFPLKDVKLASDRSVYALQDNGDIRRVVIDNNTISRPLISGAESFSVYDETTLSYIGTTDHNRVAGILGQDWKAPVVIASIPGDDSQALSIQVSKYFNKDTVVVGRGSAVSVYRGLLPSTNEASVAFLQSGKDFTLNRSLKSLQLSGNGRFIIAEDDNGFVSYDLERLSVSQEVKKYNSQFVRWLDGYHIWQIDDMGELVMQEFDGVNSHKLVAIIEGYDVVLTPDGKYIYGFYANEDGSIELRRLAMTIAG